MCDRSWLVKVVDRLLHSRGEGAEEALGYGNDSREEVRMERWIAQHLHDGIYASVVEENRDLVYHAIRGISNHQTIIKHQHTLILRPSPPDQHHRSFPQTTPSQ